VKTYIISPDDSGQRLDRFLEKVAPLLPVSFAQRYIRLKRCKVNGKPADRGCRLLTGDTLELYINDEFFFRPNEDNAYLAISNPQPDILFEDANILLALKPPGQLSHPDGKEYVNTLITHIRAYLYAKSEWNPADSATFRPALCNRIDRNTGGIVIAAKNAAALRVIEEKIRNREIEKYYLAAINGTITPPSGRLEGFLFKDARLNRVYVNDKSSAGSKSAVTEYKTLTARGGRSLVECRLLTGRTHQIRVQFAAAGHPLIGDGKYGKADGSGHQALYSYAAEFAFGSPAGALDYLRGRRFEVPRDKIGFMRELGFDKA
jgi:23S rRNA pseudouridine955/2504/2580 synthase